MFYRYVVEDGDSVETHVVEAPNIAEAALKAFRVWGNLVTQIEEAS